MFNRHLFKVILGFCGVIIFGLISLVFIDSLKGRDVDVKAEVPVVEIESSTKIPIDTKSTQTTTTKKPAPNTKSPTNKTP